MTYYSVTEHEREDLPWPLPADAWFWQTGNRWVAVYSEFHPDWWEGSASQDIAARPDPWQLPISEVPKNGTLVYRDADGNMREVSVADKVRCRHCDSALDSKGLCTDETCPFSKRQQSGGRYAIIRIDFDLDMTDYRAAKEVDAIYETAQARGIVTILEEGVPE